MGYAVYEDRTARDRGVERWAGYGVPATCDTSGCEVEINRGMGYQCWGEEAEAGRLGEHTSDGCMGCGNFFCEGHRFGDHRAVAPKPDTAEWERHMLTDESWEQWREENPARFAGMRGEVRND